MVLPGTFYGHARDGKAEDTKYGGTQERKLKSSGASYGRTRPLSLTGRSGFSDGSRSHDQAGMAPSSKRSGHRTFNPVMSGWGPAGAISAP